MAEGCNSNCLNFSQVLRNCHGFQSQSQLYGFLKSLNLLDLLGQQILVDATIKDQKLLNKVGRQTSSRLINKSSQNQLKEQKTETNLLEKQTFGQREEVSLKRYQYSEIYSLIKKNPHMINQKKLQVIKCQVNETNPLDKNLQVDSSKGVGTIKQNVNLKFQKKMKLKGGGCGSAKQNIVDKSKQPKVQTQQGTQQVPNQENNKKVEQRQKILGTEEQNIYQEGLQLLSKGLRLQQMEIVLQGIQTIQQKQLTNISDPLVLINQLIEIISHKYTEGWSQLLKEQLARNLPELLYMLLQKNEKEQNSSKSEEKKNKNDFFIGEETKKDLMQKINAGIKLVNKKRIGGPELDFDLRYSLMVLENIPDNQETNYFGIFCKVVKIAQWAVALSFGVGAIDTEAITIIKDFIV